uniref:Uncharacterized protein n=2 Tax=Branchiostoma floridae TaxID=7739 RepID=C3YWL8_BRAFL|eukprot:XP_002599250.1 hypothetical protein BRAFLDRAFT_64400 [Branchiostoma floridae]
MEIFSQQHQLREKKRAKMIPQLALMVLVSMAHEGSNVGGAVVTSDGQHAWVSRSPASGLQYITLHNSRYGRESDEVGGDPRQEASRHADVALHSSRLGRESEEDEDGPERPWRDAGDFWALPSSRYGRQMDEGSAAENTDGGFASPHNVDGDFLVDAGANELLGAAEDKRGPSPWAMVYSLKKPAGGAAQKPPQKAGGGKARWMPFIPNMRKPVWPKA